MPQVPYAPVPSVEPTTQGSPGIRVSTPGAAFGENIGQAIEGLGLSVERDSDKIYNRAIAMQDIVNETAARNAGMGVVEQVGKLHADYNSKEGVNAGPEAMEQYSKGLNDIYQQGRTNLPNDDARRRYDAFALSVIKQATNSGASHTATQIKASADNSAEAVIRARLNQIYQYPSSDRDFNENLNGIRREFNQLSASKGWTQEKADEQWKELVSGAWASRAVGTSRDQPQAGVRMLDENKDKFTEKDFLRTDNSVRGQARAVGAANIANNVWQDSIDGEGNPTKSFQDMQNEARAKAEEQFPNDPLAANHAVAALHSRYVQHGEATRREEATNMDIIDRAIQRGVRDERELRLDPTVARAIDALPGKRQLDIPGRINRYNQAKTKVDHEENFYQLKGLATNNVEEFLNTDITKYNLSAQQMDRLGTIRARLLKDASGDPRVGRAVGWMRGAYGAQMEALGIFKRTENNKEDFDHFTGALQSSLELWQQDHQKPPTYNEFVEKIAPELLKTHKEPAWFGLSTKDVPFFSRTVPEKWSNDLKAAISNRGGDEPSEQEIYKAYINSLLLKAHQGKSSE